MITNTDTVVTVTVTDIVGTPIVLSAYAQAVIVLTLENSQKSLAEYTTAAGTLTILDANAGIYTFNLKRSVTKTFPNGQNIYYTVRMYQTNTDFESNLFVIETEPTLLDNYQKTANYDRSN